MLLPPFSKCNQLSAPMQLFFTWLRSTAKTLKLEQLNGVQLSFNLLFTLVIFHFTVSKCLLICCASGLSQFICISAATLSNDQKPVFVGKILKNKYVVYQAAALVLNSTHLLLQKVGRMFIFTNPTDVIDWIYWTHCVCCHLLSCMHVITKII